MSNTEQTEEVVEAEVTSDTVEDAATVEADAPTPEKPVDNRMFQDEDILEHVVSLVTNALNLSRDNKFQPVGFQFSELELVQRTASVALDRTRRINSLAANLTARDKALGTNLTNLGKSLAELQSDIAGAASGLENAKQMSQFFLPEDQKVK